MNAIAVPVDVDALEAQIAALTQAAAQAQVEAAPAVEQPVDTTQFAPAAVTGDDVEKRLLAMMAQPVAEQPQAEAASPEQPAVTAEPEAEPLASAEDIAKIGEFISKAVTAWMNKTKSEGGSPDLKQHPLYAVSAGEWEAKQLPVIAEKLRQQGSVDLPITEENADEFRPVFVEAQKLAIAQIDAAFTPAAPATTKKTGGKKGEAKTAKAAKEPKQPKAAKESKTKAEPEIVDAPVFPTPAAQVPLTQDRTKLVVLPDTLFLEIDITKAPAKSKGHQIDPSRWASCIPVMPNKACLDATGNPYPVAADETVKSTEERWTDYVKIGHAAFALLQDLGEVYARAKDFVDAVLDKAGMKRDTAYADTAVTDALRDLALCGYAKQRMKGRSRIFVKV